MMRHFIFYHPVKQGHNDLCMFFAPTDKPVMYQTGYGQYLFFHKPIKKNCKYDPDNRFEQRGKPGKTKLIQYLNKNLWI
jgi:hypothetical protein